MSRYTVERENMEAERANLNWQVEQGIIYGYRATKLLYSGQERR